jgi:hypothetical protein
MSIIIARNELTESVLIQRGVVFVRLESIEAAEKLAALFPKYCKVKAETLNGHDFIEGKCVPKKSYGVDINVLVNTDERTGSINEAAQKRKAKILQIVRTL